jgi:hypothetical protein
MIGIESFSPPNSFVDADGQRMIPVELERGVISSLPETQLFKRWGIEEDSLSQVQWIEYWLEAPSSPPDLSRRVHRSAHVFVKQALELGASQGVING